MAQVDFFIGNKNYSLTCQEGEERLLKPAATLFDAEAQAILQQAGRMPEPRLLLLAGLMVAERASALEDRLASTERELNRLRSNPPRVEVPVVPATVSETLAELAARAEALAQKAEDQLPG